MCRRAAASLGEYPTPSHALAHECAHVQSSRDETRRFTVHSSLPLQKTHAAGQDITHVAVAHVYRGVRRGPVTIRTLHRCVGKKGLSGVSQGSRCLIERGTKVRTTKEREMSREYEKSIWGGATAIAIVGRPPQERAVRRRTWPCPYSVTVQLRLRRRKGDLR